MKTPLISVCLITYNHKDYIVYAIESILKQKKIPEDSWELIIADDCSTDGTQTIISKYKKKYPTRIKTILHQKNIGPGKNFISLLTQAKGKYIAYLEGDDFWNDDYKLKIQFDFLERNKNFVGCFGNSKIVNNKGQIIEDLYLKKIVPDEISQKDLWNSDYLGQTGTWMFKKSALNKINTVFYENPWDRILQFGLADYGNWGYINKTLSSYRIHSSGSYSMIGEGKQLEALIKINKAIISVKKWKAKYSPILNKKLTYLYFELFKIQKSQGRLLEMLKSLISTLYFSEDKKRAIKAITKHIFH